ncbi:MAG: M20/M25/M40 family metallo-hydrolase [Planctomycetota bacterium]
MRSALALLFAVPIFGGGPVSVGGPAAGGHAAGVATIVDDDVEQHLLNIASAPLEGRDSPSAGLTRAGDYIAERFAAAGVEGMGGAGGFRVPWSNRVAVPVKDGCRLRLELEGGEEQRFVLGEDFTPVPMCEGEGEGPAIFVGFGIRSKKHKYDELKKAGLKGAVAVVLDGEPRHKRKFEGEIVTPEADVHVKVKNLIAEDVEAVLIVRRPAADQPDGMEREGMGFRHTWASWMPASGQRDPRISRSFDCPVLEITPEVANRILGEDVLKLAAALDKSGKPAKAKKLDAYLHVASEIEKRSVSIDNIVGRIPGSDPDLADEYVVVGAHYDHVGVDVRGQIGYGADDNGSGTAALIEIAEALAEAGPKRSVLLCAFSGEEDGLRGSRAMAGNPPVPKKQIVAMLNLDMVGRGKESEVVVLGAKQNPDLGKVLTRAKKLGKLKIKPLFGKAARGADELWQRSDHYSFHEIGVPVLFFFEAVSILDNSDYHTWRDTIDKLNVEKITRTARLAYYTAWILAEDDKRPSPPRD